MSRKSSYITIILICIITLFIYFNWDNFFEKITIDPTGFSIENTQDVSKIIMSDKMGNKIILEKEKDNWIINKKYKVWDVRIKTVLNVIKDIEVKSSVSEKKQVSIIKSIATTGVKIEIFEKDFLTKTYFIGSDDTRDLGTYMIMEGADEPYLMHVPTENPAILTPKYILESKYVNEQLWRVPIIININRNSIREINMINFLDEDQSFNIIKTMNEILLTQNTEKIKANESHVENYLSSFTNLNCGSYKINLETDKLRLNKRIIIKHGKGTDTLTTYKLKGEYKNTKEHDSNIEVLFAKWNNSDFVIIQKNIFNKVLITLDEIKQ